MSTRERTAREARLSAIRTAAQAASGPFCLDDARAGQGRLQEGRRHHAGDRESIVPAAVRDILSITGPDDGYHDASGTMSGSRRSGAPVRPRLR